VRVLFCTQSESLPLFDGLRRALELSDPIERAGFTVADSMAFSRWTAERPQFEGEGHLLLKEWDLTGDPSDKPDLHLLADYERMLGGEAGLFGAVVADRRIFMGPDCTYSQDYRRRFSDDQLLCILQRGLKAMERLFDDLKPDVVVSFICVTMLDYLAYLFARARGIRVLNLRPTRIGDRVSLSSRLNDPSPELAQAYSEIVGGRLTPHTETARAYIRRVREDHGRYEGVVRPSNRPVMKANVARLGRLGGLATAIGNYLKYRRSVAASDNHASATRSMLRHDYVSEADLKSMRFAFFPLHTEPEVSLLVYGRPYVNQIEIIRMLAMSLPADMVLVVKEHPWMVGKRSLGAYRKMLEIPRVRLAEPSLEARTLVQHSALVSVVTGSVALEAAMLGKAVITFGDCPYNLLPDHMVRRCDDPRRLPQLVRHALELSRPDDPALEAYVAAVYETSEGINLYSVLLGKKGVHSERVGDYAEEIRKLARLVLQSLARPEVNAAAGSAAW
jgi:Capsule polysaccharide biosynthesis protein